MNAFTTEPEGFDAIMYYSRKTITFTREEPHRREINQLC